MNNKNNLKVWLLISIGALIIFVPIATFGISTNNLHAIIELSCIAICTIIECYAVYTVYSDGLI
jgi:hypothetical protein